MATSTYEHYIGQVVEYSAGKGYHFEFMGATKPKRGVLKGVKDGYARIQKLKRGQSHNPNDKDIVCVKLNHVKFIDIQDSPQRPVHLSSSANTTTEQSEHNQKDWRFKVNTNSNSKSSKVFPVFKSSRVFRSKLTTTVRHGNHIYHFKKTLEGWKIRDTAAWQNKSGFSLIGRIIWMGRGQSLEEGEMHNIAIVDFDQPTSLLSRFSEQKNINRYFVNLAELISKENINRGDEYQERDRGTDSIYERQESPTRNSSLNTSVTNSAISSSVEAENIPEDDTSTQLEDQLSVSEQIQSDNESILRMLMTDQLSLTTHSDDAMLKLTSTSNSRESLSLGNDPSGDSEKDLHHVAGADSGHEEELEEHNQKDRIILKTSDEMSPTSSETRKETKSLEVNTINKKRLPVICPDHYFSSIANSTAFFGIQGLNNSCYMDASIFSLFAFNRTLDGILYCQENIDDEISPDKLVQYRLLSIVKDIRRKYFVSNLKMKKLRKEFMKRVGIQYENSYMDVEEFMIDLFQMLNVSGLFAYDHGALDYIHQILLPLSWDESQKTQYKTLQSLLEDSFCSSDVKLMEAPRSAFIIKLPVSEGKLIPCNGVIPNITLDLSSLIEDNEEETTMQLHAVICLRSYHFVTFVRMDTNEDGNRWVFMDSQPTSSEPDVLIMTRITQHIKQLEKSMSEGKGVILAEPECGGFKLFRDAYICIYLPE